jgi:4-coumarate--CoA ligase
VDSYLSAFPISLHFPADSSKMKIYQSPRATCTDLPSQSLFTFILGEKYDGDGSRPAFTDIVTDRSLTRSVVRNLSLCLGHGIRFQLGAERRDIAMIYSPNSIVWPAVFFGLLAAGLIVSPANASYTPPELAHQYSDSGAFLLFVHPALLPAATSMLKDQLGLGDSDIRKRIVVMDLDARTDGNGLVGLADLLDKGSFSREEQFNGASAHETAVVCYSSGTTGKPKGVEVRQASRIRKY